MKIYNKMIIVKVQQHIRQVAIGRDKSNVGQEKQTQISIPQSYLRLFDVALIYFCFYSLENSMIVSKVKMDSAISCSLYYFYASLFQSSLQFSEQREGMNGLDLVSNGLSSTKVGQHVCPGRWQDRPEQADPKCFALSWVTSSRFLSQLRFEYVSEASDLDSIPGILFSSFFFF